MLLFLYQSPTLEKHMCALLDLCNEEAGVEPEISDIADAIQLMLLTADEHVSDGKFDDAVALAKEASATAYQTGDVILAVRAGCDAHRYLARVRSLASFWRDYAEFYKVATTQWTHGCDQAQIGHVKALLDELKQFGHRLDDDQDLLSA